MKIVKLFVLVLTSIVMAGSLLSAKADVSVVDLYEQTETPALSKSGNVASELVMQVDQLQETMRELRGELELQKHQLQQLHQMQIQIFKDLDKRMQALSNHTSTTNQPMNTVQSFTNLGHQSAIVSSIATKNAKPDVDNVAYHKAYALVEQRHYTAAMTALQSFLKQYPDSKYQPNAHYWLGELYGLSGQKKWLLMNSIRLQRNFHDIPKPLMPYLKLAIYIMISHYGLSPSRRSST